MDFKKVVEGNYPCWMCDHGGKCSLQCNNLCAISKKKGRGASHFKRNEVEEWESRYSTQGRERDAYESYRKFVGQKY